MCRKVGILLREHGQIQEQEIETPEELWKRLQEIQNRRDVVAGRKIEKVKLSQGEKALELYISSRVITGGEPNGGKEWGYCSISGNVEGRKQICKFFLWS